MPRLVAAAAAFAAALLFAAPAAADWDRTRWGMTPAQARALYLGAEEIAKPPTATRRHTTLKLADPVFWAGRRWAGASLQFERDEKLTRIDLSFDEGQEDAVEALFTARFGPPVSREGQRPKASDIFGGQTIRFRDAATGDEIRLNISVFAGTPINHVVIVPRDPAAEWASQEARRLHQLRQSGMAPLPPGGWQSTRWSWTRQQVMTLFPQARADDRDRLAIEGPLCMEGRCWDRLAFNFDPDYGLNRVTLWVPNAELDALERYVRGRFGEPFHTVGDKADPNGGIYSLFFRIPETGETVSMFALRAFGATGTGVIFEPRPDPPPGPAPPAPPPAPPPPALAWRMGIPDFKRVHPTATQVMEGSDYWQVLTPTLHGFTWKRGLFGFKYGELWEYTLFSTDSYDAIHARFTARFGAPERVLGRGGAPLGDRFRDPAGHGTFLLRRNHDGTATLSATSL